ncbi:hypothetical protein TNCV_3836671 [Trichonephila clavipes]|nr:hypothetical protein TNCV_3836671 [Trichonephila clavipes]
MQVSFLPQPLSFIFLRNGPLSNSKKCPISRFHPRVGRGRLRRLLPALPSIPTAPSLHSSSSAPYRLDVNDTNESHQLCQLHIIDNLVALHFKYDQARRRFVEWAQNEIAVVPDFHKRILFSDEAHFWLNGYVNKQNCRIWSEVNPQVYVETPLHPEI